jgi:transcriptional regulator of arginine metabolism
MEALKKLLIAGTASTQDEIKHALFKQGITINQSKISRLLRKMGAVKITNEQGESLYSLPRNLAPRTTQSSLSQLIIDIVANEALIIIHTNPGSASLIGGLLDHQIQDLGILGTVAGDDTVFVVPKSIHHIQEALQAIKKRLYNIP